MEDKSNEETKKDPKNSEEADEVLMKCVRNLFGLTKKQTIPNFPINKKIQKKYLKDPFSKKNKNYSEDKINEEISEGKKKEITKKVEYPSGIIKIIKKDEKNKIINEVVDYDRIKQNYINKIKDNVDKELIKLIENSFLLYNRRPIIRIIVKKPYSTKTLEEKILLWKFYIKNLTKDEKALLVRKFLYYIGKFSERLYEEFINIKEISQAHFIFLLKRKLNKKKDNIWHYVNQFYSMNSLLGYDGDGNPEEKKKSLSCEEEMKAVMLLQRQILNIKNELNGTGYGFVFLKELREIAEMYSNSSYIFESIFHECFDMFEDQNIFVFEKVEIYRVMWNFFVEYFIDDSFIINFLIELKYIFGVYKQDYVVKFIHDLVL